MQILTSLLSQVTVVTFAADGTAIETLKKSKDVAPGDIIKMTGLTQVPVDLLLILTSMHNDGNKCYIETANIDGKLFGWFVSASHFGFFVFLQIKILSLL